MRGPNNISFFKITLMMAVVLLFTSTFVLANEINTNQFAYYKDVKINDNKLSYFELDEDVMSHSNLWDLRLVKNGIEIPYALNQYEKKMLRGTTDLIQLSDGDFSTSVKSNADSSDYIFELDETVYLIKLYSNGEITKVHIEGSENGKDWKTVLTKDVVKAVNLGISLPHTKHRYFKLTLWHNSLELKEVEFYTQNKPNIVFEASESARLYYGNRNFAKPSYANYNLDEATLVELSAEKKNIAFPIDFDEDGVVIDNCPYNAGDQIDTDGDGHGDVCDICPLEENSFQSDIDGDGYGDACDNCINIYNDQTDSNGNGLGDVCDVDKSVDIDNDGHDDFKDNCPGIYNPDQTDSDNDGQGDACQGYINENDLDGDNIFNIRDNCPRLYNPDQSDVDYDGVGDACDNCKLIRNEDQKDIDGNGVGAVCDDSDDDSIQNRYDNCPMVKNADQADLNNNKVGDACEDEDKDGQLNGIDNCPMTYNPEQIDSDGNGIGDECDSLLSKQGIAFSTIYLIAGIIVLVLLFYGLRYIKK